MVWSQATTGLSPLCGRREARFCGAAVAVFAPRVQQAQGWPSGDKGCRCLVKRYSVPNIVYAGRG